MLGASDWIIIVSILVAVAFALIAFVRYSEQGSGEYNANIAKLFNSPQGFFQLSQAKGEINGVPCELMSGGRYNPNQILHVHKIPTIAFQMKLQGNQVAIDSDNPSLFAQSKAQEMIKQIFDSANQWSVVKLTAVDDSINVEIDRIDPNFDPQNIEKVVGMIISLATDLSQPADEPTPAPATEHQQVKFSIAYKLKNALLFTSLIIGFFVFMPLAATWGSFDHRRLLNIAILILVPTLLLSSVAYQTWLKRADIALLLFICLFEVAMGCYVYTH